MLRVFVCVRQGCPASAREPRPAGLGPGSQRRERCRVTRHLHSYSPIAVLWSWAHKSSSCHLSPLTKSHTHEPTKRNTASSERAARMFSSAWPWPLTPGRWASMAERTLTAAAASSCEDCCTRRGRHTSHRIRWLASALLRRLGDGPRSCARLQRLIDATRLQAAALPHCTHNNSAAQVADAWGEHVKWRGCWRWHGGDTRRRAHGCRAWDAEPGHLNLLTVGCSVCVRSNPTATHLTA